MWKLQIKLNIDLWFYKFFFIHRSYENDCATKLYVYGTSKFQIMSHIFMVSFEFRNQFTENILFTQQLNQTNGFHSLQPPDALHKTNQFV